MTIFRISLQFLLKRAVWLLLVLCLAYPSTSQATHIVGAELHYQCWNASTGTYKVTLRMLRDCANGEAPFDDEVNLFIFPRNNARAARIITIPKPPTTPELVNTGASLCVLQNAQPCVEEGIYEAFVTLQPNIGGYDLAWARCCRNNNINNLNQPLNQGVTFLAHIPGPEDATCNSMPTFDNTLPTFICANEDFYFDHSATDADGDSLVYALTIPFDGTNFQGFGAQNPTLPGANQPVVDLSNPMGPPPYVSVTFAGGYGHLSPFGPAPTAEIDRNSGLLHIKAPAIGVYVLAISVFEYRNGVLLSENKRDVQVHVLQCFPQNQPPTIQHTFAPTDSVIGDTIYLEANANLCYQVTVSDPDLSPLGVQAVSAFFNGPNAPSVTVSGTNPLLVDICWTSNCDFAGSDYQLILMGFDQANCPIYNPAFDTVYIHVFPPIDNAPQTSHQLPPSNPLGPDTLLLEVDSVGCFEMLAVDLSGISGPISYLLDVQAVGGVGGLSLGVVADNSIADSLFLNICVTGTCDNRDQLYRVILTATLDGACPPFNSDKDTLYVYVPPLPNPGPVVSADLSGNLFNGDTLFVDVHDTVCFVAVVQDSFPAIALNLQASISAIDGLPSANFNPTVNILYNGDSLLAQVCWFPICDNVDRLYRLILRGIQDNRCNQQELGFDTVYIFVRDVINPPPVITHAFDTLVFQTNGDTILIAPDSAACFQFRLSDQGDNSFLQLSSTIHLLSNGGLSGHVGDIQYTTQTDSLLEGSICFTPGCSFLDEVLYVALEGRDTFDCLASNIVFDTVFIRVIEPFNRPPVVTHDLSGLQANGDVVTVVPNGIPYCYRVTVADPDSSYAALTAEGVGNIFQDWYRYGNPAQIVVTQGNPMQVAVCWNPSCYDSGEEFSVVICARDTSRCAITETVCDTVRFVVDPCSLQVSNVFTPNGDGINDEFIPFNVIGVESFRLQIFDRWGRQIFVGNNQGWNGGMQNNAARLVPDGVYFFIAEYQFFSARGVPLKNREVGNVTLIR